MTDLAEQARRLYVPNEYGYRRIARELGVPRSTVINWVSPANAERNRRLSREAKRRRTGICERCGSLTHYGGQTRNRGVGRFCAGCAADIGAETGRAKIGTGFREQQVLALLADGPRRFMDIRDATGITKSHVGAMMNRMLKYGLVVRPSRGLYALPEKMKK